MFYYVKSDSILPTRLIGPLKMKGKGKHRECPFFVILRFLAYFVRRNWYYTELFIYRLYVEISNHKGLYLKFKYLRKITLQIWYTSWKQEMSTLHWNKIRIFFRMAPVADRAEVWREGWGGSVNSKSKIVASGIY